MFLQLILGVLLLGSLVSALLPLRRGAALARASEGWAKVRGQITESDAADGPLRGLPDVEYEYSVGDKVYHGAAVAFGLPPDRQTWLASMRARAGDAVWVHYDPANPARSVLHPGGSALRKLLSEPPIVLNLLLSGALSIAFVVLLIRDLFD